MVLDVMALAPEEPAIEFEKTWVSWGALARGIEALEAFAAGLGGAGLRVGVLLRNRPECVPALLHPLISNRCLVTLNPVYPDERVAEDISSAQVPMLIGCAGDWARPGMMAAAEASGASGISADMDGGEIVYRRVLRSAPERWSRSTSQDIAIEMMTSGTTGRPKRVPLNRARFEKAVEDWALFEKGREGVARLRSGVTLLTTSFAHIGGVGGLINTITAGRKACLLERFTVGDYHDAIVRHRPKAAGGPPTVLRMLLDANIPKDDLSSIVAFRSGTAPLDPALQMEFFERYGIPVLQNYGATEFAGGVAGWTIEDYKTFGMSKAGSVGCLNPGVEGRIVSAETGHALPVGTQGVLELKAPHFGSDDEWLRTTDLAKIDEDGFLYICGRADGAINRGGYKVTPEDVIRALESHPSVGEASVVGLADPRLGQVPVAAFTVAAGAAEPDPEILRAHLRERLSPYQVPVRFLRVDLLPRTPSLKVDQSAVRGLFGAEDATAA
jgi:acyl-coenzyme A synthetase/AMP-(fatty) acid ligase